MKIMFLKNLIFFKRKTNLDAESDVEDRVSQGVEYATPDGQKEQNEKELDLAETFTLSIPTQSTPACLEINIPYKLSVDQRRECLEAIAQLIDSVDANHWNRIKPRIKKVCQGLSAAKMSWVQNLGATCLYLAWVLDHQLQNRIPNTALTKEEKTLLAALSYFVETDDVIPDHILGEGYADDAFVVNACLKKLAKTPAGQKFVLNDQSARGSHGN